MFKHHHINLEKPNRRCGSTQFLYTIAKMFGTCIMIQPKLPLRNDSWYNRTLNGSDKFHKKRTLNSVYFGSYDFQDLRWSEIHLGGNAPIILCDFDENDVKCKYFYTSICNTDRLVIIENITNLMIEELKYEDKHRQILFAEWCGQTLNDSIMKDVLKMDAKY